MTGIVLIFSGEGYACGRYVSILRLMTWKTSVGNRRGGEPLNGEQYLD